MDLPAAQPFPTSALPRLPSLSTLRLPSFLPSLTPSSSTRSIPHPNPLSPSRSLSLSFLSLSIPIPPELSLENVLSDSLCPPLSLADFYAFLAQDRTQENLAFVLWFREFEARFWALPEEVREKAEEIEPREEWERHLARKAEERRREEELGEGEAICGGERVCGASDEGEEGRARPWECIDLSALEAGTARVEKVTRDGEVVLGQVHHPAPKADLDSSQTDDPAATDADTLAIAPWIVEEAESEQDKKRMTAIIAGAEEELEKTVQLLLRHDLPLREEVVRTVLHFLTLSSPSCLTSAHLPPLLLTLRRTTHPSSFRPLYDELLLHLTLDAHPRFVRSALVNTRLPFRLLMWGIALGLYLGGGLAVGLALVLCAQAASIRRWWRIASFPLVWAGTASPLCLWKGVCPLAFGIKRRQLSVWETLPAATAEPVGVEGEQKELPEEEGGATKRSEGKHNMPPGLAYHNNNSNSQPLGNGKRGREAQPRWWEFVQDPFVRHPVVRGMQWRLMKAAAGWGVLGMLVWGGVILGVPGR